MDCKQIEEILKAALQLEEVRVTTDGSHYQVLAVGECFEGMSRIKQQQAIYAPLMEQITSGALHALSIKTFTPTQWKREKVFNM
ncbi:MULTISPECIES: BolA family protein [Shewanella]|uniref:BolA family transcriptional regulator n=2 Tax=Shewanella TaxID=22 RepID=A0A974XRG3_9GAMM|nr:MULTISPECIES: BolA family protein [Shewanella]QSX31946.1 BolA family transcriptional regulator [Shewanella cyperi]QSX36699.1 BolA family transcriptional regulator [Shewanella sedimentimangrovi]QSX42710.1 BolA family transcriptional regulator [Shewanella cyperi]